MYHSYFGLKEQVFSIAVDPQYLYMSSQHREALAHLLYGVQSGGFVLLTGEVGTGKTTIVRCLLEQLPEATDLAIVLNPVASAPELLGSICDELRIPYDKSDLSVKTLMDKLYEHLLENHTQGRSTVLLIDEAQLLRVSALEQIRLLTNLETNTRKLLQIILVGQPELNRLLAKPNLRQLSQRITARYHLRALSLEETEAYVSHRLHIGGMPRSQKPFPPPVIEAIHATSRGIPRLINVLCDRMLLGAYSQDKTAVDEEICRQAIVEVMGEERPDRRATHQRRPWLPAVGLGSAAALALLLAWQQPWLAAPEAEAKAASVITVPAEAAGASAQLATATSTSAPAEPEPQTARQDYRYDEREDALEELFTALGLTDAAAPLCEPAEDAAYQCATEQLTSWNQLQQLDRPAVLKLLTPAKLEAFATLVGLDRQHALLRIDGERRMVPLTELGPQWTGGLTYIWRKPPGYKEPIGLGSSGRLVNWLAARFQQLDGQEEPLAQGTYNQALAQRVKIFQRKHGLEPDGIFGARTLMALNQELGLEAGLQNPASRSSEGISASDNISEQSTGAQQRDF